MIKNITNTPIARQVQVYSTLTKYGDEFILEYAQVETFTYDTYESIEPEIPIIQPSSHSIEYYLLIFLLCLVPFLIFMAYIYGKRMGQKEKWFSKMSEVDEILDTLTVSQKSTKENSTASNGESDGPLENPLKSAPTFVHADPKLSFIPSNAESSPESVVDYKECIIPQVRDRKDSEVKSQSEEREKSQESSMSSPIFENQELVIIRNESKECSGINASIKYDIDPNKKMEIQAPVPHKEQIKLHTDESQVNNYKVEFEVRTDNENGGLVKVETFKVTTVYNDTSDVPELNAQRLKRDISQIPMSNTSHLLQIKADESPEWSESSSSTNKIVFMGSSQSKSEACEGIIAKKINQNYSENGPLQSTQIMDNSKIQALLDSEDLPDETGKFNKIFKNAELIGEGSFGAVYKVRHRLDSKLYAVKKVQLKLRRPEDLHKKNKIFREIFAMTNLAHPNIVRYATCWVEIENTLPKKLARNNSRGVGDANRKNLLALKPADSLSEFTKKEESSMGFEFEAEGTRREATVDESEYDNSPSYRVEESMTKTLIEEDEDITENSNTESYMPYPGDHDYLSEYKLFLYIQMEFCAGLSLRNYLDMQKEKPETKKILQMFKKLVEGVNAIHKEGILHRDLKPANIFLDSNEDVKIGDFGLASLSRDEQARGTHHVKSVDGDLERSFSRNVGSPMYSSPEQEIGNKYNQKTDIYSLGLIFYEMLSIFATHHERYRFFNWLKKESKFPENFTASFQREGELILKMTAHNPDMRPTAEDIISEINKILERSN